MLQENYLLKEQNEQYFNNYNEQKELNESLTSQLDGTPELLFNSLELCIDGEQIPIDSNNSAVDINGREYWSKEIATKFLSDKQSYEVKDNTLYIGKIIADQTDLFSLFVNSKNSGVLEGGIVKDSFNKSHSNVFINNGYNSSVTFVLDRKYSKLKITPAIREGCRDTATATFTIKADGAPVYTSSAIDVKTETYQQSDIPINNCNLLTIECSCDSSDWNLILYDAVVYND